MSKIRKIYRENFTVLSTLMFRDRNLNLKDRGLLATMLSLPEDWDFSIKGLASIVDDGERAIRGSLQRLEELGYLIRRRVYENGKVCDWEYIFSDHPLTEEDLEDRLQKTENLDVQNVHVGSDLDDQNVHLENVQLQNATQLNTQELNKKEENMIYSIPAEENSIDDFVKDVCKIFGTSKSSLSKKDRGIIRSWFEQKIKLSIIKQAHDEAWGTFDKAKQNFNYVSGILKNWMLEGKSEEDIFGGSVVNPEDDVLLNSMTEIPVFGEDK